MCGSIRIAVDGRAYNSPDEMPPDVRKVFERSLAHVKHSRPPGEPVSQETHQVAPGVTITKSCYGLVKSERFVWDGQAYDRAEDLPPEARAHFD